MIDFKPVRLEDRAAIERYTMPWGICNNDLSFANMYCWQSVYHTTWAEVGGFLVIRFHIEGGERIGYMQPIGPGDFAPILPLLEEDARERGQRLRLIGLTEEAREQVRAMHPGAYAFESNRALEDYVYRADDLRNLTGHRYQPKRNHINRFVAEYPDYRYEELTPARFNECMALEREWRRTREEQHTASEQDAEQRAMLRAFEHFDQLGLLGGCIYVGDRMVAFTYGSALNNHTFDTHVEKADTEYDGAFTIINKLFAQHLPERFTLINREEDMGLDGLRQSKLSYHPAFLQRKFTAMRLHPDELACKQLWMETFGDDEAFVDTFIIRYYSRRRAVTASVGGQLAAMLHLLTFDTELGRTTYIYGVATAEEFRRRGLAARLMREAMQRIEERGDDAAFLIPTPGEEWLREFYGGFGFEGHVPTRFISEDGFDFGTGQPEEDRAMVWRREASTPLPDALTATYRR
ncbi:MAG TPA: GNAT family N-acetyltransferase [Candidatus Alistipes intestinipullorum]|nr:GNAT family N-acetyltransferase [Candidatus Alistipes intestinipullorum]